MQPAKVIIIQYKIQPRKERNKFKIKTSQGLAYVRRRQIKRSDRGA